MDVYPTLSAERVYVWATTRKKAVAQAAVYFRGLGKLPRELEATHTGLTEPSKYRDSAVTVNAFEQSQKVRQDTPAQKRWVVQPK